jgi:hypothetical protein
MALERKNKRKRGEVTGVEQLILKLEVLSLRKLAESREIKS